MKWREGENEIKRVAVLVYFYVVSSYIACFNAYLIVKGERERGKMMD